MNSQDHDSSSSNNPIENSVTTEQFKIHRQTCNHTEINQKLHGEIQVKHPSPVIYYNPKCSKCRKTLKLIHDQGQHAETVEYLKEPPTRTELQRILQLLGMTAKQLLRKKEPAYRESGLTDSSDEKEILDTMIKFPILIERPIVIHKDKAVIGRPPEMVLEIL